MRIETAIFIRHLSKHSELSEKENRSVLGVPSDSAEFTFAFLDHQKKLFAPDPLRWRRREHKRMIIAYIDHMFLNAIQSSPHTRPTRAGNRTLGRYRNYLQGRWRFGADKQREEEDEAEAQVDENDIVDVIKEDNVVIRSRGRSD